MTSHAHKSLYLGAGSSFGFSAKYLPVFAGPVDGWWLMGQKLSLLASDVGAKIVLCSADVGNDVDVVDDV